MISEVERVLHEKPVTREKLAHWVQGFLGFKLHDSCRCKPSTPNEVTLWQKEKREIHQSQLDFVWEGFNDEYSAAVYMACRGAGKSYATAAMCVVDAWFKPGIKIAVAAFIRKQADYIFEYIKKFLSNLQSHGVLAWKFVKDELHFANGSVIKFFSGGKSQANVQGWHPHVLIIDEGDQFHSDQFDGIANGMEAQPGFPSQFIVLSTNYHLNGDGVILKQIERYERYNQLKPPHELPRKVYRTCLIDILSKCDDRYKCTEDKLVDGKMTTVECPLWKYCKGRAKEGTGIIDVSQSIQKMLNGSLQTFESQMMLLRPSSEFAIFDEFSVQTHVLDPEAEFDPKKETYLCFDFGGKRCSHACLVAQRDVFDPLNHGEQPFVYTILDEMEGWGDLENLIERVKLQHPQACRVATVFCDPAGGRQDMMKGSVSYKKVLQKAGFRPKTRPVKRKPTFELLKYLIKPAGGSPRFVVNKRCKHLIQQIQAAEYENEKGRPTGEPADRGSDDLLDCARYIVFMSNGSAKVKPPLWFT